MGAWSSWGAWSACSKACGGGEKFRNRTCSNSTAKIDGKLCIGDIKEQMDCNSQICSGKIFFLKSMSLIGCCYNIYPDLKFK